MDLIRTILPLDLCNIIDEYSSTIIIWKNPSKYKYQTLSPIKFNCLGYNMNDPGLLIYLDNIKSICIERFYGPYLLNIKYSKYINVHKRAKKKKKTKRYRITPDASLYKCVYNCTDNYYVYLSLQVQVYTSCITINYPDENIHLIHSDIIDYFLTYKPECHIIEYISNKYKMYDVDIHDHVNNRSNLIYKKYMHNIKMYNEHTYPYNYSSSIYENYMWTPT